MTPMKMPVFTWTALCTNILIVAAFPVLTAVLAMLSLDRYVGTNFFTNDLGGNPMMYVNFIWIWGHPEVYILVLPAFGIYSEVTSTFSGKRLFGYASMVYATLVITILSYLVWLHHFFTMGSGASVNSFFGITTMIISIPTGAKIFNWLFTMYRGRIPLRRADALGRRLHGHLRDRGDDRRAAGGAAGRLRAAQQPLPHRPLPQRHHRRRALRAVCRPLLLVPQGLRLPLDPFWGKCSFWFWLVGLLVAFMPLYVLGLMGVTRRLSHFDDPSLQIWFQIARSGACLIALGIARSSIQLVVSFLRREALRDTTGDPWDGRTLEWSTSSPPPLYNFSFTPIVHDSDAWYDMKKRGFTRPVAGFIPIHMPKNTGAGFVLAMLSTAFAFGLIWHMWLLAAVAFATLVLAAIVHTFNYQRDFYIPADQVSRTEENRTRQLLAHA
jgi:cytochrome o ubiquinol oxidase subunit 1